MKIDVKNIITAFSEIHEEKLSYSIEEIEKDFLPLFNDLDLSSLFESEKDLLKRWRNVLTSRYWMYRDEHHFLDNVKSPKERDKTIDKLILRMFKHIKENKQ